MVYNISPPASFPKVGDTLLGISFPKAGITNASCVRRVMESPANVEGVAEAAIHPTARNRVRTGVPTLRRKVTEI